MSLVLVVSDAASVRDDVVGALARRGLDTITTSDGRSVVGLCAEEAPELVVCDSQIGSHGVMAVCKAVRSAETQGTIAPVRFLALLDRRPDVFLARRADADAWLVKPYEPAALRWTVEVLLADEDWDEDALDAELRGELYEPDEPDEAAAEPAGDTPAEAGVASDD